MESKKFDLPHADMVVGVPEDHKEEFYSRLKEHYEQTDAANIEGFEIDKTERDIEIINFANQALDQYLKAYGRKRIFEVPLGKVHLFKEGGVKEFTYGKFTRGTHSAKLGSIIAERVQSDIQLALFLFHELFHLKAYTALQITEPKQGERREFESYRGGFVVSTRDGKKRYFKELEEAIIEMMVMRFYEEHILSSSLFEKEVKDKQPVEFAREIEREELNELIDDIWEGNKEEYPSREKVFDLFLDAQINGHLLSVAKLIDKTYGKGSFRELGELTADDAGRLY
jgi:hypothetical protein